MMDSQDRFGWQVRQWLNRSAMDVSPTVQNRLQDARRQALARQRKAARKVLVDQSVLATERLVKRARPLGDWFGGMGAAVPAMAVALGLFFLSDAQLSGEARRMADIDALVLGDELPISAYLDDGFSAFLRQADLPGDTPVNPEDPAAVKPGSTQNRESDRATERNTDRDLTKI